MRGEHGLQYWHKWILHGSSPRAWGTPKGTRNETITSRIIPTCVGNTGAFATSGGRVTDHPHVRGEHFVVYILYVQGIGSSPRAWGTLKRLHHLLEYRRIIPTCVGNTNFLPYSHGSCSDHPHVRGEHLNLSRVG